MFGTVSKLAEAAGGTILSGNPEAPVGAISTDTRKIVQGDCFVALAGENHDGHAFAPEAMRDGTGSQISGRMTLEGGKEIEFRAVAR